MCGWLWGFCNHQTKSSNLKKNSELGPFKFYKIHRQ